MKFTPKSQPSTSLTVSEVPLSATEPLGAMKRASGLRSAEADAGAVALGGHRDHLGQPVDMARDDMAAELVADPERAFEIDPVPRLPGRGAGADVGLRDRLGRDVDLEPGAAGGGAAVGDGQADAVAGDRGAERDRLGRVAAGDARVQVAAILETLDPADVGDDAREHPGPPPAAMGRVLARRVRPGKAEAGRRSGPRRFVLALRAENR
jgi:hypothetical protein